ncbi:MAG TPA: hypothetical protein VGK00_07920 [Anaerolineales bacterium]|jgi:hypothetical protein
MTEQIEQVFFTNPLFSLLEEVFVTHHGIFLDANTSLFQTLETVSAEQASVPVGGKCASLAAQVAHVIFYLEVLERFVVNKDSSPADWGEIWRTVEKVTPAEWNALRDRIKQTYYRIENMFKTNPAWDEDSIGGAMAVVVHSAYHLGEIRQALCTLT